MKSLLALLAILLLYTGNASAQSAYEDFFNNSAQAYQSHYNNAAQGYASFREKANKHYIEFLKKAWGDYDRISPIPKPVEQNPIPPRPYDNSVEPQPVTIVPEEVPVVVPTPQPTPIEPIQEHPVLADVNFRFNFYGISDVIRLPQFAKLRVSGTSNREIADGWNILCDDAIENTIYDCLHMREKYNLCDWAYLSMLKEIASQYCDNRNGATLLMAFLYCQSGYQMRLAIDNTNLLMLYGSQHQIFDKGYFDVDGTFFYPYGESSESIRICNAEFDGESPLSLYITKEQFLGNTTSSNRQIKSKEYPDVTISSIVPLDLITFFNDYPTSVIDGNVMTRWAMYANTPLAGKTKDAVYPKLRASIANCSELVAANKLLNWVQTGFVYDYDDKVWGHDRAFFAEESLYYPYCDCEDRSILFSRLVRDLLGLDVALLYYPGHLATAVKFNEDVLGDAILINGQKFIVSDPTYIGAPVGYQMPDLEYDKTQTIVLKR